MGIINTPPSRIMLTMLPNCIAELASGSATGAPNDAGSVGCPVELPGWGRAAIRAEGS